MTREDAINELKILKEDYWDDDGYGHETKQYDDTLLALDMAIKALDQEPREDTEVIKVSKGAVKARQGRFVIYDVEWLKKNFYATEEKIYGQPKETCEDCISREKAKQFLYERLDRLNDDELYDIFSRIIDDMYNELPSVTPKYTEEEIDRAQAVEEAYVKKMVELTVEELKRPKGKWISHREHCENLGAMPNGLGAYQWCSNCDCAIDIREWQRNHYNFCPNCGARMAESEGKA